MYEIGWLRDLSTDGRSCIQIHFRIKLYIIHKHSIEAFKFSPQALIPHDLRGSHTSQFQQLISPPQLESQSLELDKLPPRLPHLTRRHIMLPRGSTSVHLLPQLHHIKRLCLCPASFLTTLPPCGDVAGANAVFTWCLLSDLLRWPPPMMGVDVSLLSVALSPLVRIWCLTSS